MDFALVTILVLQTRFAVIRSPNQKFIWEQADYADVAYFEVMIDDIPPLYIGKPPVAGITVEATIPSMTNGRHTIRVRACNHGGCSDNSNNLEVIYHLATGRD